MTHYYGVIGNRDYIKFKGEKRPYWEFLDNQPDGWLTSLAYRRKDFPEGKRMIFDCGAWSYKEEVTPKLGKSLVTPAWALQQYSVTAHYGDFVVAPDHMLIESLGNMEDRRAFNRQSAQDFIELTRETGFVPMAVVHGTSLEERIAHARELVALGYTALSLGGMAGRASAKREHIDAVYAIRQLFPDVWLHVLGLSSPEYAGEWFRIGVNSFDGSSHFKQAFTAGAFFTEEQGKLTKHRAAHTDRATGQPIEDVTAPLCNCRACALLRSENIDTRTYGSNESNMGRAAHNQNMLMRAHQWHMRRTYALVSCVGEKMDHPVAAGELYQSDWFLKAKQYVKQHSDAWFILSALHGLLSPATITAPYEKTLNDLPIEERRAWAQMVYGQILNEIPPRSRLLILAGAKYRDPLIYMLRDAGYEVSVPLEGLGIGQQLQWFNRQVQFSQSSLFGDNENA